MFSSKSPEENEHSQAASVTLTDEAGRTLVCYVERSLFVDSQEYVLLLPVDSAIEVFAWQSDGDEEEAIPVEEDAVIDEIFPLAEAVLSEQNLTLKRTAFSLTVDGELPPAEESELFTLAIEEEDAEFEPEQLQLLASFYHEEQEYAIYTPLDPLLFFARLSSSGQPELLSPEEYRNLQPLLEEQLFDELE